MRAHNQNIWTRIVSLVGTSGPPITLASNQHPSNFGGEHFQSIIPTEQTDQQTCKGCA